MSECIRPPTRSSTPRRWSRRSPCPRASARRSGRRCRRRRSRSAAPVARFAPRVAARMPGPTARPAPATPARFRNSRRETRLRALPAELGGRNAQAARRRDAPRPAVRTREAAACVPSDPPSPRSDRRTISHFGAELSSELTQCADRVVRISTRCAALTPSLCGSPQPILAVAPVTPARRVDDLDRKIIEALQENGRESFRRIAARLGVSEGTIRARYARLTSEGILQVVAVTNPLGLGFDQALVGLKTSGSPGEVADEISRWPRGRLRRRHGRAVRPRRRGRRRRPPRAARAHEPDARARRRRDDGDLLLSRDVETALRLGDTRGEHTDHRA